MRCLHREEGCPVRLNVVGMAVSAVSVICDDNMWAEAADLGDEPAGGLVEWRHPEGVREQIGRCIDHPRIAVAQELDLVHLEDAARLAQLGLADLGEMRTRGLLEIGRASCRERV